MKNFKQNLKNKPTLFLIIGIFVLFIGIPFGVYGLTLNGGASLGGVLVLLGVFIFFPFLVIDRILVNKIKPIKLSIFEFLFIGIVLIFYLSNNKKLYVDLSEYNSEYFVVIYNNGDLKNSELNWSFPINKKIKPKNNSIIIPEVYKRKYQIKVETPIKWHGSSMNPDKVNNISLRIYTDGKTKLNRSEKDSLAKQEIMIMGNFLYN
ncbi:MULTISPECIES: hypothetical protein [Winogradskyella]|uniref:hypothetical protein n=1 Tax=Winogradskyella TaxID=286104 RepID=UPI0015CD7921|nr:MULTISPECIES: hypothetical protein [Winogradskyella]QXP80312.1 hypothetical protein H0I32_06720 [Winogradskyella sp. HaHa_3_26]